MKTNQSAWRNVLRPPSTQPDPHCHPDQMIKSGDFGNFPFLKWKLRPFPNPSLSKAELASQTPIFCSIQLLAHLNISPPPDTDSIRPTHLTSVNLATIETGAEHVLSDLRSSVAEEIQEWFKLSVFLTLLGFMSALLLGYYGHRHLLGGKKVKNSMKICKRHFCCSIMGSALTWRWKDAIVV